MTSIASAPLKLPVGEPKRDPVPARAGGSGSAPSFKAALATASTGAKAEGLGRPTPQATDATPTRDEAARPVLTLLALAKAASQGEEPPEAEAGEAGMVDEATEPTSGPAAPVVGKPEVTAGAVIAVSHPATAHAAPAALPHVAAPVVVTAPVPADELKPPARTATDEPAASPLEADPSDLASVPPSDGMAAAGTAIVIGLSAAPVAAPEPAATAGGGAAASGSARPATPGIAPAAAGGSSAGQGTAPTVPPAVIAPSAPAQGSQPPTAPGSVPARTPPAAGDIAPGRAPVQPALAATAGLAPVAGASPVAVTPAVATQPVPATTRAEDAPPQLATAPRPASVLPTQQPVAPVPAAATLARTDAPARIVPAEMPVAAAPNPPVGGVDRVKPEAGSAPLALPATAPVARAAVPVAPPPIAAAPAGPTPPVHDAVPSTAEHVPSEPVSPLTQTAAAQTAATVSAPVPKGTTASEPGKAAAPAPVPPAAAVDASGSQGASQDGATGQGRGDGQPPSPVLRHEGIAAKPFAAPAVAPASTVAGAPEAATGQVLQLLSSLGLTRGTEDGTAADGSTLGTPAAAAPPTTRPSSVPDTVTLQLAPEALGRITVTLRLRGQALDVRLVADKRATLESLGRDRHQLEAALGVSAEAIDIAFGPQAGSAGPEGAPQRSAPDSNSATSDQGHGRSRGRPQDAGSSGGDGDGTGTPAPERPTERRDGSLYL